jgi:hypothetical protein
MLRMNIKVPKQNAFSVTLREADDRFIKIQQLLDAKTKLLEEKQKYLKQITTHNIHLKDVLKDYAKYGSYIVQQKRDQMVALELLNEYINDLNVSGKLTKHNIEDAKMEQSKILHELQEIKNYLDDIVE